MGDFRFTSFLMYTVLLVVFLGLINMVFDLHNLAFVFEFFILLLFMLMALIAVLGIANNMRWAWILLTWLFGFVFIDVALIYSITAAEMPYFFHIIGVVIAGFFISLFSIKAEKEEVEAEEKEEEAKKEITEKTFKPGKYIASKTGLKFHSPKCDWAKKIKKENVVWFDSKEDAIEAGYKEDECVK